MDFRLTDEQRALQEGIARVLETGRIAPRVRAVIDGKQAWDAATWNELVELGVPAIIVSEEHGGLGLSMIELALAAEELGRSAAAVPFLGHAMATVALIYGGTNEQKAKWLPKLASGEVIGSVALTDGNDSWAPAEWSLECAGGKLSGRKSDVPNADRADLLVVGLAGGELALVDMAGGGVSARALDVLDQTRPLHAVEFAGAAAQVLGDSATAAQRMWDAGLALLAADSFGGARHATLVTRDYVLLREAFGAKIAEFQAIKHQMANLIEQVEPARGLYWYAAYAFARLPDEASLAAANAKAHAAEVYMDAMRASTEMHGGIGFTWEYDLHILFKRAMFNFAWGGRPQRLFARAADLSGW
jgi:alkylation response protein AidB-like acyl-CoA dehydrogenase